MKRFTSRSQKMGELGERIALKYLIDKGFMVIEQNYTKKIGEIDIVALKEGILHFIEVKSLIFQGNLGVSRGTRGDYSPFQNVSYSKMKKFSRTCELYLLERRVSHETRWQIDVISVVVSRENRSAQVKVLWNVMVERR